jgi:hypothetical protein
MKGRLSAIFRDMLKLIVLTIFILQVQTGWSKDLTSLYLEGRISLSEQDTRALQKYKVIIVPGVLAQSFISDSSNQIKMQFFFKEGFREQISVLQQNNIDYDFLDIETENTPAENAATIINAIERSTQPVLIYSHSKGGLDVLEALRQRPQLLSKIHGWATIQSPFYGAPLASPFSHNIILRTISQHLFEWMGGDRAGLSSLTPEERVPYMNSSDVKSLLKDINRQIKFINYASFKKNSFGLDTPLEFFRDYTEHITGKNDGVVPLNSALLKDHGIDVNYILESEVDHLMTMTKYRLKQVNFNQKTHTMSVLKLLL